MLEICQNAAGSTDLAMDRHGHDGPSWTPSSHTCGISSAALLHYPRRQVWRTVIGTMFRRGPSFQSTSTLGIWVLGSLLWTSWQTCRTDRHRHYVTSFVTPHLVRLPYLPSAAALRCHRRTVTSFVTPHLVRLPHLPSADALHCHLRTVASTMDRHKLRRLSLLYFFAQNLRILLWKDFLQNKEKLI